MGTHPLQELQYVLPVNCKCGYKYIVASNSFGQPRIEQISVRTFYYYQTETMKDHSEIFSDHLKFQLINEIGLICSSVRVGNVATGKFANLSSQLSCHQSSLASFRQAFNFEKHTLLPQCFYYVKLTFGGTAKQMYFQVHAHIWHDWRKISEIFKLQILRDDSTKFSKRPMTPLFWKN